MNEWMNKWRDGIGLLMDGWIKRMDDIVNKWVIRENWMKMCHKLFDTLRQRLPNVVLWKQSFLCLSFASLFRLLYTEYQAYGHLNRHNNALNYHMCAWQVYEIIVLHTRYRILCDNCWSQRTKWIKCLSYQPLSSIPL